MIIDVHGHSTQVGRESLAEWRKDQVKGFKERDPGPTIPDEEIRTITESKQLSRYDASGVDVAIISPRASAVAPHMVDGLGAGVQTELNVQWAWVCNNTIHRIVQMFPQRFVGVCQLPQIPAPRGDLTASMEELERCVKEFGFVGCNLNPDPSGGKRSNPILTDRYWYPFYEKMIELEVPAMLHVSGSCDDSINTTGELYVNADTSAFEQLMLGGKKLFEDLPDLKLIIPHAGGAAFGQFGRFRGIADMKKAPDPSGMFGKNVFLDTVVYDVEGMRSLFNRVASDEISADGVLYAAEIYGAAQGKDPKTGTFFDDTMHHIDALDLPTGLLQKVFRDNALRAYPRLGRQLMAQGVDLDR